MEQVQSLSDELAVEDLSHPPRTGRKYRQIDFVPAIEDAPVLAPKPVSRQSSDLYRAIVMKSPSGSENGALADGRKAVDTIPCDICGAHLALNAQTQTLVAHEASIRHQSSLQHQHPPSAIDRRSRGFTYLSSRGWDPDGHIGLGAKGEGRLDPVRAVEKKNKFGIGARDSAIKKPVQESKQPAKPLMKGERKRLNKAKARQAKKYEALIMGNHEVNRYTGVKL